MSSIKKQGFQNTVITYFGILIGFINLIIIQPYFLTAEELGLTRLLYSFSAFIATIVPLGISNITLRYFPRFKNESGHNGYFGFMLIFPVIGFLLAGSCLYILKDFFINEYITEAPLFAEYFYYIFPLTIILGLINVLTVYSYALFKTTFPVLLNDVIIRLVYIILLSLYFIRIIELEDFINGFVFVYLVQLLSLLLYIHLIDNPSFRINFRVIKQNNFNEIIGFGLILMVSSVSSLGLKLIDVVFVGKYLSLEHVAVYSIAAFIPTVIEAPLNGVLKIASPRISSSISENDWSEVKRIYYGSSKYLFVGGGFLFLIIVLNIKDVLSLLPVVYMEGIYVVYIMCLSAFINSSTGVNNSIIINSSNYKYGTVFLFILLVTSILGNYFLIPIYGLIGAAITALGSNLLFNGLNWLFLYKKYKLQPFKSYSIIALLIIVSVAFLIELFFPPIKILWLKIGIKSIVISILYFIGIIGLGIFKTHELFSFINKQNGKF